MRAATEETRGRALASAITSTAASTNGAATPRDGGFERATTSATSQMAALAAMATDLYGTR